MSGVLLLKSVSAAAEKLFALTLMVVEVGAETKITLNPIVIFDVINIIDVITSKHSKKVRFCQRKKSTMVLCCLRQLWINVQGPRTQCLYR
jgi:hypothetical protein